jgi:hypothetical protein
LEDTSENLKVEDTAGSYTHRQHSREIHTWRTQQEVIHIDNTAGRYTLGGNSRKLYT